MDEGDTKDMAKMTRKLAREAAPEDREAAGSHDFPSAVGPGGVPLGQQGTSQTDDISGQAPASGMARQHARPAIRREGESTDEAVGDGTRASSD